MSKYQTYINFAIRSGSVIYGLDNILNYKKNIYLIIIDTTFNLKNKYKLDTLQDVKKCKVVTQQSGLISDVVNKPGVKVIAISNKELSKAILLCEEVK